ncbi:hypothetical protein BBJ28_00007860 [Nothophytophthora sp. Chile5]|nr:hypothetical protein BBJ28_00007860 [Nothophytophthora sp. Chile5]
MLGLGLQVDATKAKSIGLVDEAVALEEVFPRAEAAMGKWLAIPGAMLFIEQWGEVIVGKLKPIALCYAADMARVRTKLLMRQETADRLIAIRQQDLEAFTDFAQTDKVQKSLGMYLASLKKNMPSTTSEPLVLVEKKGEFAVVRLNRLPVNALNTADLYLRLYITRLASVAAIEGHSPAGGCLLAMCCDYRIMTSGKPMIGLNETQLGIVAPTWFRDTFVNTIGHREAEKMLGLGLQVDATKAKSIGLVDEAVALEEVFPRSEAAMGKWLAIPGAISLLMRQETADRLIAIRQQDLEAFTDFAQTDKVQKSLGMYLASLKKK